VARLIEVLKVLSKLELVCVLPLVPGAESYVRDPFLLNAFVENLYNAWREYERFVVVDSRDGHAWISGLIAPSTPPSRR